MILDLMAIKLLLIVYKIVGGLIMETQLQELVFNIVLKDILL